MTGIYLTIFAVEMRHANNVANIGRRVSWFRCCRDRYRLVVLFHHCSTSETLAELQACELFGGS